MCIYSVFLAIGNNPYPLGMNWEWCPASRKLKEFYMVSHSRAFPWNGWWFSQRIYFTSVKKQVWSANSYRFKIVEQQNSDRMGIKISRVECGSVLYTHHFEEKKISICPEDRMLNEFELLYKGKFQRLFLLMIRNWTI